MKFDKEAPKATDDLYRPAWRTYVDLIVAFFAGVALIIGAIGLAFRWFPI
ncbi:MULTISPECIES: hypothetical protein [unclassified Caballeronia]|nr:MULTISPECIES: hypothetical protein [unclassified Caballeronia]